MIFKIEDFLRHVGSNMLLEGMSKNQVTDLIRRDAYAIVSNVNKGLSLATPNHYLLYYRNNSKKNGAFRMYGVVGQDPSIFDFICTKWCVYRITDIATGKVYHGESDNFLRRIREHCENSYDARTDAEMCEDFVRGNGSTFEILFVCDTYEEARNIEIAYNNMLIPLGKKYTYNKIR